MCFSVHLYASILRALETNCNHEERQPGEPDYILLRNIQVEHAGQDPSEIPYPPLNRYTATISHTDDVYALAMKNTDFTVGAYNYLVMMAQADSLDTSMASLGQTREIINALDNLAATRTYPLTGEKFSSPFKNVLDFLPRDPAAQKAKAEGLSQAALNEVNLVDNIWHGTEQNPTLNPVIKKKRNMSALTLALFGWEALVGYRERKRGHSPDGRTKVSMFASDFVYRMYDSLKERLEDVEKLFRTSKAAVVNTLATPSLFKSVAQPYKAIKTKETNTKNNKKRTDEYRAAKEILARNKAPTSTIPNENGRAPFYDESEDEGDECPKRPSSEENNYEEERDEELNQPRLNEGDDNDFEPHWDLVVQYLASRGEKAPINNDVEASTSTPAPSSG
ncbi:hypothetical protein B0T09DRAFT_393475 [Sordaria sp. MPI-SDFR-AT-0083]|nr:hypothetical protein B0T09DRAFT_393475 [Sordaria sp. MPI-SDFR-AT-0083]